MAKTLLQFLLVLMCMKFPFTQSSLLEVEVTDDSNTPLENVSVTITGFAKGTTSLADGSFSIGLPALPKNSCI